MTWVHGLCGQWQQGSIPLGFLSVSKMTAQSAPPAWKAEALISTMAEGFWGSRGGRHKLPHPILLQAAPLHRGAECDKDTVWHQMGGWQRGVTLNLQGTACFHHQGPGGILGALDTSAVVLKRGRCCWEVERKLPLSDGLLIIDTLH